MFHRQHAFVLTLLLLTATPGCSLFKRGDAGAPGMLQKLVNSGMLGGPPQTDLGRNSALGLYNRLLALFPDAGYISMNELTGGAYSYKPMLDQVDFDMMLASGDNLSLSNGSRPLTGISMVTLGRSFSVLCRHGGGPIILAQTPFPPTDVWSSSLAGSVFSPSDVLMAGEMLPVKTVEPSSDYWAFIVARNAFLYPYTVNSPEVKTLSALYQQVYNLRITAVPGDATRATRAAQSAVCEAALNAPQFLLGNAGKLDVVRRVAIELAGRRPTFSEISAIQAGASLDKWIQGLQSEAGYTHVVNRWHRDWLGLRPFMLGGSNPIVPGGTSLSDYDQHNNYYSQFFTNGWLAATAPMVSSAQQATPEIVPFLSFATGLGGIETIDVMSHVRDGTQSVIPLQDFDPRTSVLVVEDVNAQPGGPGNSFIRTPTPVMAWILKEVYEGNKPLIESTYPGLLAALPACWIPSVTGTGAAVTPLNLANITATGKGSLPQYYLCATKYGSTAGTLAQAGAFPDLTYQVDRSNSKQNGYFNVGYVLMYAPSLLAQGYHYYKLRRYSPQVIGAAFQEQNGRSLVKFEMTQEPVYALNTTQRFYATCAMRPDLTLFNPFVWADSNFDSWSGFTITHGITGTPFLVSNPYLLNLFRCGTPNLTAMTARPFDNEQAYPYGFDVTQYQASAAIVSSDTLNTTVISAPTQGTGLLSSSSVITGYGGFNLPNMVDPDAYLRNSTVNRDYYNWVGSQQLLIMPSEQGALYRLQDQINNEPYYMLDYIRRGKRPYSEFFNARYTIGGPELDYYYRTQSYMLPALPNAAKFKGLAQAMLTSSVQAYQPAHLDDYSYRLRDSQGLYPIYSSDFDPIPTAMLTDSIKAVPVSKSSMNHQIFGLNPDEPVAVNPREQAGILTMPAFLSPVATGYRMRTISSRVYQRLLCGDPNVVSLNAAETEVHRPFMADKSNPLTSLSAQAHLDPKNASCLQCHINLDPLAAALNPRFLANVQYNEPLAMTGEFFVTGMASYPNFLPLYGIRASNDRGQGAFLGKPASGFAQVADILVQNTQFYQCVVNTMFQNLYGRMPLFQEANLVTQAATTLKTNQDFDAMIRQLATAPAFETPN